MYPVKDNGIFLTNRASDLCVNFLESLVDKFKADGISMRVDALPLDVSDMLRYDIRITDTETDYEKAQFVLSVYSDGYMDVINLDTLSYVAKRDDYDYRNHTDYEDAFVAYCNLNDDDSMIDYQNMVSSACNIIADYVQEDFDSPYHAFEDVCSAGITQCPSYVPTQPLVAYGWLAGHTEDVPVIPDKTDKSSMDAIRNRNRRKAGKSEIEYQRKTLAKKRRFEADEETGEETNDRKGMFYRFYSLLYAERHLSELLKYPEVENNVHDFEIFTYSPSGVKAALQEKMFLKKQDYAIINRIRNGFADVIVGYLVPESVKDTNTWEYAEISVGMNQDIKVMWRH